MKSGGGAESSQEGSIRVDVLLGESLEKVEHRKDRAVAKGIEDLIDARDHNLGGFSDFIQLLIVDGDSNTARFLQNAYERAGSRGRGVLNEAGGKVRVQDGVRLLREGRVQSERAQLDQLYSERDLDFKGAQGACTVIQFGQGEKYVHVFCDCRAESVDSTGVPTGSV